MTMPQAREQQGRNSSKFFYGWIIAVCCTLITIMNGGIAFSFSVFFESVTSSVGWSRAEFSGNYTAMMIAYAPGSYFAGRLADRHGPRPVLVISGLLILAGFAGASFSLNTLTMMLSYIVIGLGLGPTVALPTATIQKWFVKGRGPLIGIVAAGTGLGGLIFAPLASYIVAVWSWHIAYLVMGLVFGGATALSACLLVSEPKAMSLRPFGEDEKAAATDAGPEAASTNLTLAQAFRLRAFWYFIALSVITFMSTSLVIPHLVPYSTDRGISAETGARALGFVAGASVVARIIMSWIAGRTSWMKNLALAFFGAGIALVWLAFVGEPGGLYIFAVAYGFTWGSTLALMTGAIGALFGQLALSEMLGFLLGLGMMVGSTTAFLGGLSFDLTGSYTMAFASMAMLFAVAGVLSLLVKETR